MLSKISNITKRYPIPVFFVLTYILSWWPWLQYPDGPWPIPIFTPGPFLAAVIVLAITAGKSGVKDLLRRVIKWRVAWRWYLVALGLPTVIAFIAATLNILWLGAPVPTAEQLSDWPFILPTLVVVLLVPGLGGPWEEPGWRGYAQDRLQMTRSPLVATLIVALFGVIWHLPLFLINDIQWPDVLMMPSAYIVLTWIYNGSGRSILLVMLTHATNNAVSGNFFSQKFSGKDSVNQALMLALVWGVVALVIVVSGKLQRPANAVVTFEPSPEQLTGSVEPVRFPSA